MLDESGSIGSTNFELMKSFLSHLVDRLDIDSGNTRVGFVMFATNVGLTFNLNTYSTVSSIKAAISSIQYSTGGTDTAGALAYVRTVMLRPASGDRGDVPNIIAVITDGQSNDPQATQVFADVYYNNTSMAGGLGVGAPYRSAEIQGGTLVYFDQPVLSEVSIYDFSVC